MSLPAIPGLDASKLAIAPYLLWVKIGAAVLLLIALALSWWRISTWHEAYRSLAGEVKKREAAEVRLAAEVDCLKGTACEGRALRFAQDGAAAVEKARQAAQDRAREEQARVAADGQAAVQRAEKAASVATVRLREVEARYRAALTAPETGCAEQAREPLRCPLR